MPVFSAKPLEEGCAKIFRAAGLTEAESKQVAHSLVLSNLMGHDSHGVIRVTQYLQLLEEGKMKSGQEIRVVREADASAVMDGGWGFGQIVCRQAMKIAMEKASAGSVAAVELFQTCHIGRLGEYVEMAAESEMIGMIMCNNHGGGLLQAPFGGIDPKMSPNPLSIGFPTGQEFPIIVDMTSSVVAEGKIRLKRNLGETIPDGWALDADGNPVNDPDVFYGPPRGAILPMGGIVAHKGFALAIMVDLLSGVLGGGGCSRDGVTSGGNGVFLMVLDIRAFTDMERYYDEIGEFTQHLKRSRLAPGVEEIFLPGEIEGRLRKKREEEGVVVDEETWRKIQEVAQGLNVPLGLVAN